MTPKPVVPRGRACLDVDETIAHYLVEGSGEVALGFIDALEKAYQHIARHPRAGSPRYGHELALPGLRTCSLKGYPYLVFYVETAAHIDVWRVLHAQRDIPAWLSAVDE